MIEFLNKYRSQVLLLSAIIVLLIGNILNYRRILSVREVVSIMLLILLYFKVLDYDLKLVNNKNWLKRMSGIILFAFILATFLPFSKWVIYEFYPKIGIFLFKINVPFDPVQFKLRVISSFTSVLLFTLANNYFKSHKIIQATLENDNHSAKSEIENLRFQLDLRNLNPHFVESIFSTGMGKSLMGQGQESAEMLVRLNQVLRYVLDQDIAGMNSLPLKIEWDYCMELIDILQWKYEGNIIEVDVDANWENCQHKIIPLSLVTILENAIKYAIFRYDASLSVSLVVNANGFIFECSNQFDPIERSMKKSSEFGLNNLRDRLSRDGQGGKLLVEESGNRFTVRLIQEKF